MDYRSTLVKAAKTEKIHNSIGQIDKSLKYQIEQVTKEIKFLNTLMENTIDSLYRILKKLD